MIKESDEVQSYKSRMWQWEPWTSPGLKGQEEKVPREPRVMTAWRGTRKGRVAFVRRIASPCTGAGRAGGEWCLSCLLISFGALNGRAQQEKPVGVDPWSVPQGTEQGRWYVDVEKQMKELSGPRGLHALSVMFSSVQREWIQVKEEEKERREKKRGKIRQ